MRGEIVCVGTELLLGNIVNTNAAAIARDLAAFGVDVYHHSTVGDNLERCAETLRTALSRAEAVVVTGGIGPTPDDATREAIAKVMGVELERREDLLEQLRARYAARGREPNPSSLKQADLPVGADCIPNPTGTAPGVLAAVDGKVIYALPGVPSEMTRMLAETVLPDLRRRFGLATGLFARVLRTRGVGESQLADELDDLLMQSINPTVATYVRTGEVEVRLTARARDAADAAALWEPVEAEVRRRIGAWIYAVDDEGLEVIVGRRLTAAGADLATAESCTGGMIGERLTSVPGSSRYYVGGVVAYADAAKARALGVPAAVLSEHGAVSEAAARAMAEGVAARLDADLGLAVTGIAGPDGGSDDKPVGLVYLALHDRRSGETTALEQRLAGDRAGIRERTTLAALDLVCRHLTRSDEP